MLCNRVWAMPNKYTLNIKPINELVRKYLKPDTVSFDIFAANQKIATHTNDLDPTTSASYHLEASAFLELMRLKEIRPDLIIFDPPYSLTQVARSYNNIGLKFKGKENPTGGFPLVKDKISQIIKPQGYVISFGWNSIGMGVKRGFDLIEILLVCHGGNRNDTICSVEQKISPVDALQAP